MQTRLLPALVLLVLATGAHAASDPVKGKRQFAACVSCHGFGADGLGPSLKGFIGKPAGTNRPKFAYSAALKRSHLTWDDRSLDAWLKSPRSVVPGTNMNFVGITSDDVRSNVIAYLKQQQ